MRIEINISRKNFLITKSKTKLFKLYNRTFEKNRFCGIERQLIS